MKKKLVFLALALFACGAMAQDPAAGYPNRPLRFIVPYPPGALTDVLARVIGERLATALKQPVVVENRAGAGTLIGADLVAKAPADGYTLLMATSTTLGISPAIYSKPHIDAVRDFFPVSLVGSVNFFLVTAPSLGVKSVAELVDLVRRNPGRFNYASSGSGSPHHLFMEVFKKDLALNVQHVPYKGSALAVLDLIAGKPEMMFLDFSVAVPNIQGGKITALGTSAAVQSVLLPGVSPVARTVPRVRLAGLAGRGGHRRHAAADRCAAKRRDAALPGDARVPRAAPQIRHGALGAEFT